MNFVQVASTSNSLFIVFLFIDRGLGLGLENHLGHALRAGSKYVNLLFIYLFIH